MSNTTRAYNQIDQIFSQNGQGSHIGKLEKL